MQQQSTDDYKKLFSELIKKQMLVLGPDITLARVKNVAGVEVSSTGDVTNITGDPQQLLQALINQFVELSGLIVKKTMESILTNYAGMAALTGAMTGTPVASMPTPAVPAQPAAPIQPAAPVPTNPATPPPALSGDQISEINKLLENMNKPT